MHHTFENTTKKPVIFLAFANDKTDESRYLRNLPEELRQIRKILEKSNFEVIERANVQIDDIFDVFTRHQVSVFHYGGHADDAKLLLETDIGNETAFSQPLMNFLASQKSLKLVFLNGCSTKNQVKKLQENIPAVIGTRSEIEDEIAKNLAVRFYQTLGEFKTVQEAWETAQNEIQTKKGDKNFRALYRKGKEQNEFPWELVATEKGQNWKLPKILTKSSLNHFPKYLTTEIYPPSGFIFRETELKDLYNHLFDNQKDNVLLLLNGQGGIGKTSLARKYAHEYQNEYAHLAWLLAEPSILDAIIRLKTVLKIEWTEEEKIDAQKQLDRVLLHLVNLDKPSLLILDNANQLHDLETHFATLRKCPNFHILLTSRINEFELLDSFMVQALSKEQALQLFQNYYPKNRPEENPLFENIYDAIDGNTLVIEVLAKNLHQINTDEAFYPLSEMVKDIQKKGLLQLSDQEDIRTAWRQFQKVKPEQIIEAIYDLRPLDDDELYLLSNFSVLPSENIAYEMLKELLSPENPRQFSKTLQQLYQKGWIDKTEINREIFYKTNPVGSVVKCMMDIH